MTRWLDPKPGRPDVLRIEKPQRLQILPDEGEEDLMESTIRLRIFLFGYLKDGIPENVRGQEWIEMPEGTTTQDLVEYLGVTRYHLGTILVNGAMAQPQQILVDGDQVKILPIVGGG